MNWDDQSSEFLFNPRLPQEWVKRLTEVQSELPNLPAHIWILSSGSTRTDQKKWIALSKQAFLNSAKAVNTHFQITDKDIWLQVLPRFHVGGLSIEARSYLSKSKVISYFEKWDAKTVYNLMKSQKISLVSLVPTQLFDLVQLKQKAPESLRAVIIGGGALNLSLLSQAQDLGYPVFPSFGMTETASQVAAGIQQIENSKIYYKYLPHADFKTGSDNRLSIKASSLMSAYAEVSLDKVNVVKIDSSDWFLTNDLAEIKNQGLCILGRQDEVIKVSGELVSLQNLRQRLDDAGANGAATLLSVTDDRLEHRLIHIFEKHLFDQHVKIESEFQSKSLPFERPHEIYFIDELPRTDLGKIKWAELKGLLGF